MILGALLYKGGNMEEEVMKEIPEGEEVEEIFEEEI
jgi:hypothetical protein